MFGGGRRARSTAEGRSPPLSPHTTSRPVGPLGSQREPSAVPPRQPRGGIASVERDRSVNGGEDEGWRRQLDRRCPVEAFGEPLVSADDPDGGPAFP